MGQHFPDYQYSDIVAGDADIVDQVGNFGEILEGAHEKGLLSYAPQNELSSDDARVHHIRNRTIATRLWLLGYLPAKPHEDSSPEETYTDEFKKAIKRFQSDGNLSVDGWAGDQTWYALDGLVSFESETEVAKWFKDGEPCPALERAVQLRLFSLGLYPTKPDNDFIKLAEGALDAFRHINIMFKLTGIPLPRRIAPEAVKTLFDQDNIVEKLADAVSSRKGGTKSFVYHRLPNMSKRKADILANRFIVNVAKVELWLIGFDVNIDGKDDYQIHPTDRPKKNQKLFYALSKFWEILHKKDTDKSIELARSITPDFFVELQKINDNSKMIDDSSIGEDYSKEVAGNLKTNEQIEEAWNHIQKRSVSLWDGLKRLWRWIKRGFKKIISLVGKFVKNLYRAFFRYATKAYKIVKIAINSVVSSIEYYFQRGLKGSSLNHAAILHDKDFDQTVFINNEADPEKVATLGKRLKLQTAIFKLGTRIISLVFDIFKKVVGGILGWARVLWALVQGLGDLKPLYNDLKPLYSDLEGLEES